MPPIRTRLGPLAYLKALGPGLVAGASDNDPTTVATMSVAGATAVYGLSTLTILVYPMLASIQIISAQVGLAARSGLQKAVRELYGRPWAMVLLAAVLAVNIITIGADLEAGEPAVSHRLSLVRHPLRRIAGCDPLVWQLSQH